MAPILLSPNGVLLKCSCYVHIVHVVFSQFGTEIAIVMPIVTTSSPRENRNLSVTGTKYTQIRTHHVIEVSISYGVRGSVFSIALTSQVSLSGRLKQSVHSLSVVKQRHVCIHTRLLLMRVTRESVKGKNKNENYPGDCA